MQIAESALMISHFLPLLIAEGDDNVDSFLAQLRGKAAKWHGQVSLWDTGSLNI